MQQWESLRATLRKIEQVWQVIYAGANKIHAKRMAGSFRSLKWKMASLWLCFLAAPYLRWEGRQAILFDIPGGEFYLFGWILYYYDIWLILSVLVLFFLLLVVVTLLIGRAFCGYLCFQTVWGDLFCSIEAALEGSPQERTALHVAPWRLNKLLIKVSKHALWLLLSVLTAVSFMAWFTDVYQLWRDYRALQADIVAWLILLMFTAGTYISAGFMREQVCFWLCPYAQIQRLLYDKNTLLPTYDEQRGEPRVKLDNAEKGDWLGCIDCDQCVMVCPTGVDIREGEQIGCITCGLCIDACNSTMDMINQPHGLIRYGSWSEFSGEQPRRWFQRPKVWGVGVMILLSGFVTTYGLSTISEAELTVFSRHMPMYAVMDDGVIQNSYHLRIFNKSMSDNHYHIEVEGFDEMVVTGNGEPLLVYQGRMARAILIVQVPREQLSEEAMPIKFRIVDRLKASTVTESQALFMVPQVNRSTLF